jgi:hypothetical protein
MIDAIVVEFGPRAICSRREVSSPFFSRRPGLIETEAPMRKQRADYFKMALDVEANAQALFPLPLEQILLAGSEKSQDNLQRHQHFAPITAHKKQGNKRRKNVLKIELRNRITLLTIVVLALSGAVVPGIMSIGTLSSNSSSALNQDNSALHQLSPSNGQTLGSASHIGTVDVSSLPAPQEKSQAKMMLNTMPLQKSYHGTTAPAAPPPPGGGTSSAVNVISGFEGLNMIQGGGYVPPDVQVATGPNHVVEMVNLAGEVFTKQGANLKTFSLPSFFNSGRNYYSDPKVLYDASSGRWFASIIVYNNIVNGNVTIAVSTSNDPTGTWNLYKLVVNDFLPDQPLIGISNDKFVVASNDYVGLFDATGAAFVTFEGAQYWVLNKSELVAGASTVDFDSVGPDPTMESVYPVQSLSSTTTQYMVSVGAADLGFSSSSVKVLAITGVPPSTVTVGSFSLTIATASEPPNAIQPGTNINVTTNDQRVLSAAWSQGNLWYSLTDSCVPSGDTQARSCARLTEISTSTSSLVQDINYGTSGQYYFFPALSIDGKGGMDIVYGYSSSTIYPSLAVTGQASGAKTGTLATAQVVRQGSANDTSGRYGDFFGAGVDPSDTTVVWVAGEYHNIATGGCGYGLNCWATFIASMTGVSGFAVSPNPAYLFTATGSAGTSTITVTPLAGFSGTVTLTARVSIKGPNATLSPTSITLPPTGSSTLTVTVPKNFYATFTITVNATSGSTFHLATVTVIPNGSPDFTMSTPTIPDPTSIIVTPLSSTFSIPISLASLNGFSGTVNLSGTVTPANPVVSFSPSNVAIGSGGLASSTMTITVSSGTPTGLYSLTASGTSGSAYHTVPINLAITPINFPLNNVAVFGGVKVNSTGSVSIDSPVANFRPTVSGTVSIVATNSTTGAILASTTNTISSQWLSLRYSGGYTTVFVINVTAGVYPLGVDVVLNLSPNNATSPGNPSETIAVTRNPDVFEQGQVSISDYSYINARANGCSQGMSCYDPRADLNADGVINAADLAIEASYVNGFDFNQFLISLNSSPSSLTVTKGYSTTATVALANNVGFAGTASLTATSPAGLTATLNPTSITVSGTSTLTISASTSIATGQYSVVVSGSNSFTTRSTTVSVTVSAPASDFTVAVNPSPVSVPQGFSSTPTVTLTSIGGFQGTVSLTVSTSFMALTASASPTPVSLSSGGSVNSTLTVNSSTLGSYSISITATSGSISHSLTVRVYVTNFIFNSNGTSASFKAGSPGAAVTFYMVSVNGPLTFTLTAQTSSALTATFGTNPVNMPAGGFGYSIMGLTSNTIGNYRVTVTASSGPLHQSIIIFVSVCATWNCGGICRQPPCPTGPTPQPQTPLQLDNSYSKAPLPMELARTVDPLVKPEMRLTS